MEVFCYFTVNQYVYCLVLKTAIQQQEHSIGSTNTHFSATFGQNGAATEIPAISSLFSAPNLGLEHLWINHELNAAVVGTICWTLVVCNGIVVAVR